MTTTRVLALTLLYCCSPAALVMAQGSPPTAQKAALIRQILDETGSGEQMLGAMETSVPIQRASNPKIPKVFWDRFLTAARERKGEFLDSMIPLYNRTFTEAELKGLLQFYQSPLGQRLLQVQPDLIRESMQMGQRWGYRLGAEIGRQLAAEGVKLE